MSPKQRTININPLQFFRSICSHSTEIIIILVCTLCVLFAPFNKVEENFETQAIHDILYHQTDLQSYDHFEHPGIAPRSFIGPFLVAIPTFFIHLFLFNIQQWFKSIYFLINRLIYSIIVSMGHNGIITRSLIDIIDTFIISLNSNIQTISSSLNSITPPWISGFCDLPPPIYPKFLPYNYFLSLFFQKRFVFSYHPTEIITSLHDWLPILVISRCVMGFYTAISLIILMRSIKTRFGSLTGYCFFGLIIQQFHTIFYSSRFFTNIFALQLITIVFALLLQLPVYGDFVGNGNNVGEEYGDIKYDDNNEEKNIKNTNNTSNTQKMTENGQKNTSSAFFSKKSSKLSKIDKYSGSLPQPIGPITHLNFTCIFGLFNIKIAVSTLIPLLLALTVAVYRCDMLLYIVACGLCYCIIYPLINKIVGNNNNQKQDDNNNNNPNNNNNKSQKHDNNSSQKLEEHTIMTKNTNKKSKKLSFSYLPTLPLLSTVMYGIIGLIFSALLSVIIDSVMWSPHSQVTTDEFASFCPKLMSKFTFSVEKQFICSEFLTIIDARSDFILLIKQLYQKPHYILPFLYTCPPLWPEFNVLFLNIVENNSTELGLVKWHYYFTTVLPKIFISSAFLFPLAFFGTTATSCYFVSTNVSNLLFRSKRCDDVGGEGDGMVGKRYGNGNDSATTTTTTASSTTTNSHNLNNIHSDPNQTKRSSTRKQQSEFDQLMDKMEEKSIEKKNEKIQNEQNKKSLSKKATIPFNMTLFAHVLPIFLFIILYSILPHKELRFILPLMPSLYLVPSLGLAKLLIYLVNLFQSQRKCGHNDDDFDMFMDLDDNIDDKNDPKSIKNLKLKEKIQKKNQKKTNTNNGVTCCTMLQFLCLSISAAISISMNQIMFLTSIFNYPGGLALFYANDIANYYLKELNQYKPYQNEIKIHIDNGNSMNGANRFGELKLIVTMPQSGIIIGSDYDLTNNQSNYHSTLTTTNSNNNNDNKRNNNNNNNNNNNDDNDKKNQNFNQNEEFFYDKTGLTTLITTIIPMKFMTIVSEMVGLFIGDDNNHNGKNLHNNILSNGDSMYVTVEDYGPNVNNINHKSIPYDIFNNGLKNNNDNNNNNNNNHTDDSDFDVKRFNYNKMNPSLGTILQDIMFNDNVNFQIANLGPGESTERAILMKSLTDTPELIIYSPQYQYYHSLKHSSNHILRVLYSKDEGLVDKHKEKTKQNNVFSQFDILVHETDHFNDINGPDMNEFQLMTYIEGFVGFSKEFPFINIAKRSFLFKKYVSPSDNQGDDDDGGYMDNYDDGDDNNGGYGYYGNDNDDDDYE